MKATVRPISAASFSSRFRICACVETSRPETISSASTKFGRAAPARARCRRAGAGRRTVRGDSGSAQACGRPTRSSASATAFARACRASAVHAAAARRGCWRIVWRGLSDDIGSWKIICRSRRSGRIAASGRWVMSRPSKRDRAGARLDQPHQRAAERRLAGAGFADDADRLAAADRKSRPCRISAMARGRQRLRVMSAGDLEAAQRKAAAQPCGCASTSVDAAISARSPASTASAPASAPASGRS